MNRVMDSLMKPMGDAEKFLDSQLWHACAGGMVQLPPVNSKVFYFPQGHAEHAHGNVDFGNPQIPPLVPCRVSTTRFMADHDTDEVYAKIRLVPLRNNEFEMEDEDELLGHNNENRTQEKPASFAKTLTQSDANNGGGFSVPRFCAETIFPRLDYSAEPPVQTILAKDVHGEIWKFRHIYRGTPRRHLLTTGWSNFVNQKKLVAGDSIVFLRADNGDLCVGVRRAKKGIGGGIDYTPGWNPANSSSQLVGYSDFMRENESRFARRGNLNGRVTAESVIEAATLAASGKPFEIVYYPCAGTPEFFVKASTVRSAMQIHWCSAMRFKMPFETEDASRISWFMGTISSVQVADPIRWPNSPWRLLQVTWDEPDLLQNVKSVNPWLVEVVVNMPAIHVSPFSPPRKKPRFPLQAETAAAAMFSHLPMPSFSTSFFGSTNPLLHSITTDNIPAGIQGARHTQYGLSPSDFQFSKLQSPPQFPVVVKQQQQQQQQQQQLDGVATPLPAGVHTEDFIGATKNPADNLSHWLTMGNHFQSSKENKETKPAHILLFGQIILPDQQTTTSKSCSGDNTTNNASDAEAEKASSSQQNENSCSQQNSSSQLENSSSQQNGSVENNSSDGVSTSYNVGQDGHCKVFMEWENVGRTLDLSVLGSYEELYRKLASMFGVGSTKKLSSVIYQDAGGTTKHAGDEPFSEFLKTARRLTVVACSK